MKKIALNVKNMKEALVNYTGLQCVFDEVWNTFQHMALMGFITDDEWHRFYDECRGWCICEWSAQVKDMDNGKVIWTYNPDTQYRA